MAHSLKPGSATPRSFASPWFFKDPSAVGGRLVHAVREYKPTLIIAVDFLFWFAYGAGLDEAQRLARLEQGLKLLQSLPGPLLVGDLPDMSSAEGKALEPGMAPSAEVLARLNQRIAEWTRQRGGSVIVPLGSWTQQGPARRMLQKDGLHPTREGGRWIATKTMEVLRDSCPSMEKGR